jgi:toxin FitB
MLAHLLDSNLVSELLRARPEQRVLDWVADQTATDLYLSAITLGELTRGIAKLPTGRRRSALRHWLDVDLEGSSRGGSWLSIRTPPRSGVISWAKPTAEAGHAPQIDAQIAATALQHDLTLVTRNSPDFVGLGVHLVNPWEA